MLVQKNHPFHMVDASPWPILISFNLLCLTTALIKWFLNNSTQLLFLSLFTTMLIAFQWWRDITRESTFQGLHSYNVINMMKMGMILFIISEIFFFISFFWAFFHSSLSPTIELGMQWPPSGIKTFNPMQIPLLNTIILLSSGISITWTHHSIIEGSLLESKKSLLITVILGIYFTILQGIEYWESSFTFSDSIYGSTFFMSTGFHGIHVIVGTLFLIVSLMRLNFLHFSNFHHFGFEAAAWYWHFVDVVWLFLYLNIYWWGN
uniref:Cytochrome c oxidase subunit 3 n=1 Tax=Lipothrix lubbocki TaxID=1387126 RepID=A0A6H0EXT5_9HEXA|nr:cytochrome c oxidase subunit 3 [Lipothrix lubbocki]